MREKVYSLVKKVPKGKVTSYKIIADKLGSKSYRAIGRIMKENTRKEVPCHRVINHNCSLGGYNKGLKLKIKKLKEEGIEIKNNKIDKKYFFNL